jgi:hypothetical protein
LLIALRTAAGVWNAVPNVPAVQQTANVLFPISSTVVPLVLNAAPGALNRAIDVTNRAIETTIARGTRLEDQLYDLLDERADYNRVPRPVRPPRVELGLPILP